MSHGLGGIGGRWTGVDMAIGVAGGIAGGMGGTADTGWRVGGSIGGTGRGLRCAPPSGGRGGTGGRASLTEGQHLQAQSMGTAADSPNRGVVSLKLLLSIGKGGTRVGTLQSGHWYHGRAIAAVPTSSLDGCSSIAH